MRRPFPALLLFVVLVGSVHPMQAQAKSAYFFGSAGVTLPMGDYGDYAKGGWIGNAGVGYNISDRANFGAEVMYGSNKHKSSDDRTDLLGVGGFLDYTVGNPKGKIVPYLLGGLGVLNQKFKPATGNSESESKLMISGGGGLYFPMGTAGLYLESRYIKRGDTGFLGIAGGFTVGL
ncbi:MAG: outer membrane beta-barrel protein [Gemmatimonadota bacterium]